MALAFAAQTSVKTEDPQVIDKGMRDREVGIDDFVEVLTYRTSSLLVSSRSDKGGQVLPHLWQNLLDFSIAIPHAVQNIVLL